MELNKNQISQFFIKKKRSNKTDFQKSISDNDKELFFAYIKHFENKKDIDIFNMDITGDYTLLQYVYALTKFNKDTTLFNFLYEHPRTNIKKESKSKESLLNMAVEFQRIEDIKKFSRDGIVSSSQKSIFASWLSCTFSKESLTLLSYLLDNFEHTAHSTNAIEMQLHQFVKYCYEINKTEKAKNLLLKLHEKIHKASEKNLFISSVYYNVDLFSQAVEHKDMPVIEMILKDEHLRKDFSQREDSIEDHPLYLLINQNKEIFELYKKHPFPLESSPENDSFLLNTLFENAHYSTSKKTKLWLDYLINDLKLNPCISSEDDENSMSGVISLIKNYLDYDFNQNPVELFKILESSPYFDINYTTHDSDKNNILSYLYNYDDSNHDIINSPLAVHIKKSPNLQYDCYDNPESSLLMLSIAYNDTALFDECMTNINLNWKSPKKENVFQHFLGHDYINKKFLLNILRNKKTLSEFINHAVNYLIKNNKNKIDKSMTIFTTQSEQAVNYFLPSDKDQLLKNIHLIHSEFEKFLLAQAISFNNNEPNPSKKRL